MTAYSKWYSKKKKEDPEGLKKYRNAKQQRYRAKKKAEKKKQETQEINEQYRAGNLNFGVKMAVPKPLSWEQFQKENPNCKFWDYLEYKISLTKPRVEKIKTPEQQKTDEITEMKRIYMTEALYGNDPDKLNLGLNFFGEEKTDRQLHEEENRRTRDRIEEILNRQKRT